MLRENHTYAFFLLIMVGVVAGAGSLFGAVGLHLAGVPLGSPWHIGGQVLYLLTFAYLLVVAALDAMDARIGAVPPLQQKVQSLEKVVEVLREDNQRYQAVAQAYRFKVQHVTEELQGLQEKVRTL